MYMFMDFKVMGKRAVSGGLGAVKSSRYLEIDALRGLAAAVVLVYHLIGVGRIGAINGEFFHRADFAGWVTLISSTIFNGTGATILFFVISGFVLGQGAPETPSLRYLGSFATRRVLRIMPSAWASLALASALAAWYFHAPLAWNDWVGALLLQQPAIDMNGPLWSLQIEMLASCVYLVLLYASRSGGVFAQVALLALLVWVREHYGSPWWTTFLFCFQFGIMVSLIAPVLLGMSGRYRGFAVAGAIMLIMLSTNLDRLGYLNMHEDAAFAGFGSFILVAYCTLEVDTLGKRILSHPISRFFGRISYSLYLCNLLLIRVLETYAVQHFGTGVGRFLFVWFVGPPLCIAAGYIGCVLIEEPFHRFGRRIGRSIMQRTVGSVHAIPA